MLILSIVIGSAAFVLAILGVLRRRSEPPPPPLPRACFAAADNPPSNTLKVKLLDVPLIPARSLHVIATLTVVLSPPKLYLNLDSTPDVALALLLLMLWTLLLHHPGLMCS